MLSHLRERKVSKILKEEKFFIFLKMFPRNMRNVKNDPCVRNCFETEILNFESQSINQDSDSDSGAGSLLGHLPESLVK